jgi:hypothetical protein
LKVGSINDTVEVKASSVQLQTEDAVTGQVVNRKFVNDLPLVDRNFSNLAYLAPGVTETNAPGTKNARQSHFHGPVSMVTFGSEQYQWHSNINGGTADPDGPAARSSITSNASTRYTLPKASVTVLAGKLGD